LHLSRQARSSTSLIVLFILHKWNKLEHHDHDGEESFAKQLGTFARDVESKLLGLSWNKREDIFTSKSSNVTKRGILSTLASVYDPLGLVLPIMLQGKLVYHEACKLKTAWDATSPAKVTELWMKFTNKLSSYVSMQRTLATFQQPLDEVRIHAAV
jgi:hypothetical protein